MCLHLSFLVLSGRNESTSFSLFNQFPINVFRKVLSSASFTGIKYWVYVELYVNVLKYMKVILNLLWIAVLNKIENIHEIYWIKLVFGSLSKSPHFCFNFITIVSWWQEKKRSPQCTQRVHKQFNILFKLLSTKFPFFFSYSHSLLYLCSASPASEVVTVLILNSYMKTCSMHYTSFLKIKTSMQHTQYPKALITSSLHIGQVRWSKSQGSMHVLWKMCLEKKKIPFRTYYENHTLLLQKTCKALPWQVTQLLCNPHISVLLNLLGQM